MSLTIDQIKELIPHRYPFLLVDRVDELVAGERAKGIKNVTANEEYFMGHFPDYPVMPGVLQLEALAQLVGCCLMAGDSPFKGKLAFYAGVDGARFKRQVRPGDTLTLEVEVLSVRRNICKAKGVAKVGEEIACEAEMMFAIGK